WPPRPPSPRSGSRLPRRLSPRPPPPPSPRSWPRLPPPHRSVPIRNRRSEASRAPLRGRPAVFERAPAWGSPLVTVAWVVVCLFRRGRSLRRGAARRGSSLAPQQRIHLVVGGVIWGDVDESLQHLLAARRIIIVEQTAQQQQAGGVLRRIRQGLVEHSDRAV